MLNHNKQNGMTIWGVLIVASLCIMITILFFKLLPPYMEYGKVKTALENVARQPNAANMEKGEISAALERRFDIDDVKNVDLKKNLFVEKKPTGTTIRIAYERRVPIAYNVTALIEFDHTVTPGPGAH
jgi:hypothetical protein